MSFFYISFGAKEGESFRLLCLLVIQTILIPTSHIQHHYYLDPLCPNL